MPKLRANRFCPKCKDPRAWRKVKPPGARSSRFECIICGAPTKRIKYQRKKDTMSPRAYDRRQKGHQANELWRHLIYQKADPPGACAVNPEHRSGLQAMHLFPKGKYPHLRFEIDNGAPGCAGCHHALTNDHERHRDFCIRYLGAEKYEALRLRSISRGKLDIDLTLMFLRTLTEKAKPPRT